MLSLLRKCAFLFLVTSVGSLAVSPLQSVLKKEMIFNENLFKLEAKPCSWFGSDPFATITLTASPGNSFTEFIMWTRHGVRWLESEKGTVRSTTVHLGGSRVMNALTNSDSQIKTRVVGRFPCSAGFTEISARVANHPVSQYYLVEGYFQNVNPFTVWDGVSAVCLILVLLLWLVIIYSVGENNCCSRWLKENDCSWKSCFNCTNWRVFRRNDSPRQQEPHILRTPPKRIYTTSNVVIGLPVAQKMTEP